MNDLKRRSLTSVLCAARVGFWAVILLACSSSNRGPDGGAITTGSAAATDGSGASSAGSCAGSAIMWKDDGTAECASSVEAILATGSQSNSLEIVGTQGTTIGLSIIITSPTPLGGSYDCTATPAAVVEITYRDPTVDSATVQSCTVTLSLTQPGDAGAGQAVGTFSVVLDLADGGIKNITDGVFDIPTTIDG
jgi:hypothetical protein